MANIIAKAVFVGREVMSVREDQIIRWRDNSKNAATYANQRRKEQLPNPDAFQGKLAQASSQEYRKIANILDAAGFESKKGKTGRDIGNTQENRLMNSFDKYQAGLEYQHETLDGVESKRFKDAVDKGTDAYGDGVAKTTMKFTGDKITGRGISALAGYFLTGDKRVEGMLRTGDKITSGGPVNVARLGLASSLKSGLAAKLTQAGVLILESNYDTVTIDAQNGIINDFIKGLQKAAYVDFQPTIDLTKSYCVFFRDGGESPTLKLEIQVVTP